MTAFDTAWLLIKRQTELGEHHEDFPSSHGPVTHYHGTSEKRHTNLEEMDANMRRNMNTRNPFRRLFPKKLPLQQESMTNRIKQDGLQPSGGNYGEGVYTSPEKPTSQQYADIAGERNASEPTMFGVRGGGLEQQNKKDIFGNFTIFPNQIPPERVVQVPTTQEQPAWMQEDDAP
jgi:hypothetical protein